MDIGIKQHGKVRARVPLASEYQEGDHLDSGDIRMLEEMAAAMRLNNLLAPGYYEGVLIKADGVEADSVDLIL